MGIQSALKRVIAEGKRFLRLALVTKSAVEDVRDDIEAAPKRKVKASQARVPVPQGLDSRRFQQSSRE
jgi:hypothetical protein